MGYYPRYADFDDYLDLEERNSRFVLAMEQAHQEAQQWEEWCYQHGDAPLPDEYYHNNFFLNYE